MPLLQRPPFWLPPDPPRSGGVSAGAINLVDSKSGAATNTVITVTLPAYLTTDYIVLFIASNNGNAQTYQANVTATNLANTGDRVAAYRIVPVDGAQTTFTVTVGTSSVFSWWIGSYRGVAAGTVYAASNAQGNSTVSTLAIPAVTAGYVAAGGELALWCGGVNATATWTTDANTIFTSPSANNAAMMVSGSTLIPGQEAVAPASMDRGINGTNRNQNSVALILPASAAATPNLLANASFEAGTTIATSWQDEHTTVGAATYSLTTTGLTDGAKAQTMAYTGQGTDTGTGIVEIFQSPITGVSPGDLLEFDVWLSGSLTNTYCFIGIEGFSTGQVFISENDTNVLTLTAAPTKYTVQYTCPAGTVSVAAYLQVPSIGPTVAFSINLDQASLVKATSTGPAAWAGGATALTVSAASGSFTPGVAPWAGSAAALVLTANSGVVSGTGTATVTGGATALTLSAASGSFTPGTAPWVGSAAALTVAAAAGSFTATGSTAWTGSSAALAITRTSGSLASSTQFWAGSSTAFTVATGYSGTYNPEYGASGSFTATGSAAWTGASAALTLSAASGSFAGTGTANWAGSSAARTLTAASGSFNPTPAAPWAGSAAALTVTAAAGSFLSGAAPLVGTGATLGLTAGTGAFTPTSSASWAGSTATRQLLAVSGSLNGTGTGALIGSTVTVTVSPAAGTFTATGSSPWAGAAALLAITATGGLFTAYRAVEITMPVTDDSAAIELVTSGSSGRLTATAALERATTETVTDRTTTRLA